VSERTRYYATGARHRVLFRRLTAWRMARQARGFAFDTIMRLRRSVSAETWADFVAWKAARP
jgi:hypothetical protein